MGAFSPEFRNRLDNIIHFKPLPVEVVRMIVDKFLGQLNAQVVDKEVKIVADEKAKDWLCKRGYKPEFGAREMSRVIHRYIKQPLADMMLFGDLQNGGVAEISTEMEDDKEKLIVIPQKAEKKVQLDKKEKKKKKKKKK